MCKLISPFYLCYDMAIRKNKENYFLRKINKDILTWVIVITFFAGIIFLYNKLENDYTDLGEKAPVPTKLNPIVKQNQDKLLKKPLRLELMWLSLKNGDRTNDKMIYSHAVGPRMETSLPMLKVATGIASKTTPI